MGGDGTDEPAVRDVFSLLGHEIRLEILLAFLEDWEAVYTEPVSYAELMDAVDVVDSGKFNYHLGKLRGVFVRKVEDGYVPTAVATALYRAVVAHQPHRTLERERFDAGSDCPNCGTGLVGRHERGFLSVECPACEAWRGVTYPFPANAFDGRSDEAVVRAFYGRARHHLGLARSGQCPFCGATTTVAVRATAVETDGNDVVAITCDACTFAVETGLLFPLLADGRVAAALVDAGLDPTRYVWELPDLPARVRSRDPLRVEIAVPRDDGATTIVVDGELTVRTVESDR